MPSTLKTRNRAVLDSVIKEVANKRIMKYRLNAGDHFLNGDKDDSIRTNSFSTRQFLDQDFDSYTKKQEYSSGHKTSTPKRRILSRSLSDPTGTFNVLHLHESFGDISQRGSSQEMTQLLETAGQLTWLHFLSESVGRQNKHRRSEPIHPGPSMTMHASISQCKERKGFKNSGKVTNAERNSWRKENPSHPRKAETKRWQFVAKTGKAYFAIRTVHKNSKKDAFLKQKSVLKRASVGNIICYNSSLPPIREAHPAFGNGISNASLSESANASDSQDFSKDICPEHSSLSTSLYGTETELTPQLKPSLYDHTRSPKVLDKKVFFDVTSESSDEQQLVKEKETAGSTTPLSKRLKVLKGKTLQQNNKNDVSVSTRSIKDICSHGPKNIQNFGNTKRFRKNGKVENKTERPRRAVFPSLPTYEKIYDRRYSMATQASRGSSLSESESDSLEEEALPIKGGLGNVQFRQRSHFDRKFSNTSMQVFGDTSRPSITNPSETFEQFSGNVDNSDNNDYAPPPLPERMVSFATKINAWRAAGPNVPRPRARTSGSLPSIIK